jgi:hypothetical protein
METWCKVKVDEASEEVDKVRKEVEAINPLKIS